MNTARRSTAAGIAAVAIFAGFPHHSLSPVISAQTRPTATVKAADAAFNVRSFGARGDGKALDSPAINRAIDAAVAAGGGTVVIPAGTYRSFSIRLKSNITLYLDQGATILAASPNDGDGKYD